MNKNFTDRSIKVFELADQEAKRLNRNCIDTEHVLLGLLKEGSGVAVNVLMNLDLDLEEIREEVEKLIKSGFAHTTSNTLPQTPRVEKVIEQALQESKNMDHTYVGTGHLLLALMIEGDSVATQVLENLNITAERIIYEIHSLLGTSNEEELKTCTVRLNYISGKVEYLFDICIMQSTSNLILFEDTKQVEFGVNIDHVLSYKLTPDEEEL